MQFFGLAENISKSSHGILAGNFLLCALSVCLKSRHKSGEARWKKFGLGSNRNAFV